MLYQLSYASLSIELRPVSGSPAHVFHYIDHSGVGRVRNSASKKGIPEKQNGSGMRTFRPVRTNVTLETLISKRTRWRGGFRLFHVNLLATLRGLFRSARPIVLLGRA